MGKRLLALAMVLILCFGLGTQALAAGAAQPGNGAAQPRSGVGAGQTDATKKLQRKLKALGYYAGAVDGLAGGGTTDAIKLCQKANGLAVTGRVDAALRKLLDSGKAITKAEYDKRHNSNTATAAMKKLQQKLKALGYYAGAIDGLAGGGTTDAIKLCQRANGLAVTGKLNAQLRRLLDSGKAISKDAYYAAMPVGYGDSGYAVTLLQKRLKALKYYTGPADGDYGTAVKTAVSHFQAKNSLPATGRADVRTRKAMNAKTAVAYAGDLPAPNRSKVEKVIAAAKAQLGKPYVLGATGMSAFDCSGLTRYAFEKAGVELPRSAHAQGYQHLTRVSRNNLKRGDLVCLNTIRGNLSSHVGIYLGDGQFIHASSSKGKVIIASLPSDTFSWGLRLL